MKTKTTLILASTILSALFAAQSAVASQATEENYFATGSAATSNTSRHEVKRDIIKVSIPTAGEMQMSTESYDNFFPEGQGQ